RNVARRADSQRGPVPFLPGELPPSLRIRGPAAEPHAAERAEGIVRGPGLRACLRDRCAGLGADDEVDLAQGRELDVAEVEAGGSADLQRARSDAFLRELEVELLQL